MIEDPYKVLGVSRGASEDEIKQAYLALVKKYHPDKYQGNPLADLAEEKLQEVNEAYDMLKEKSVYQSAYGPAGGGYANTYGGEPGYISIRQALDRVCSSSSVDTSRMGWRTWRELWNWTGIIGSTRKSIGRWQEQVACTARDQTSTGMTGGGQVTMLSA